MSPQQKGVNWTIVALVISTGTTIWYTGHKAGTIETSVSDIKTRLDRRDAKDDMQDGRLLGHDISISGLSTDVQAIKEGRYTPPPPTPGFENPYRRRLPQ